MKRERATQQRPRQQRGKGQGEPRALPLPPFRLRALLVLLLLCAAAFVLYRKGRAAWALHSLAGKVASYSLCMVGPTGPGMLRAASGGWDAMLRRRLLAAWPEQMPFSACKALAGELSTLAPANVETHDMPAIAFGDYWGGLLPEGRDRDRHAAALSAFALPHEELSHLAERAWPILRDGYRSLLKASPSGHEAVHIAALPAASAGRGLPRFRGRFRKTQVTPNGWYLAVGTGANRSAYRSTDGGKSWTRVNAAHPDIRGSAGVCSTQSAAQTYRLGLERGGGKHVVVRSLVGGSERHSAPLAREEWEVVATACSGSAFVAGLRHRVTAHWSLRLCLFGQMCQRLPEPNWGSLRHGKATFDIARIEGTTLIVMTHGQLARVASSRDNGRTWTPFSTVFDSDAQPTLARGGAPNWLLTIGDQVLLYRATAAPEGVYPLLASSDHGASWFGP